MNLKGKLYIVCALILLIPSLFIGWTSYNTAKDKVDEQITQSAIQNIKLLNEIVNHYVVPRQKDIEYLSDRLTKDQFNGMGSPLVRAQLDPYQKLHSEIQHTYIGTDTGLFISSPGATLSTGADLRNRP